MIRVAAKLSRATSSAVRSARLVPSSHTPCLLCPSPPSRLLHDGTNGPDANPVAIQMINYALSHARSQKSGSSLIHFYLYFKISQTFFIFLFFMVKKKKFIVFVFCAFCRGIIRTRSSGIGAMPFHSVEWRPRCWEFKGFGLVGHVYLMLWKVFLFLFFYLFLFGSQLVHSWIYCNSLNLMVSEGILMKQLRNFRELKN